MPPNRRNKPFRGPKAWVEVTHVSQRVLKIPHYSSKENSAVCLGQLASISPTVVRVPVNGTTSRVNAKTRESKVTQEKTKHEKRHEKEKNKEKDKKGTEKKWGNKK
jgi:hypothetical protein